MSVDGFYYLHTNGDLIFKKIKPEIELGGFVKRIWGINVKERASAWILCVEALALGANKERVKELAEKWKLTNEDAKIFASRVGLRVFEDGSSWFAVFDDFVDLQESDSGFGDTALDALAALAKGGLTND